MLLAQRKERFDTRIKMLEAAIKERLAIYADAQYAGTGLFLSSEQVTRNDWRKFVTALHLLTRYPGINGIGFAMPVSPEDTASFVREVRKDGAPDFRISTSNPFPGQDLYVIKYIEPIEKNKSALGYDMGSERRRRFAMEKARDLGEPVITERVTLVQDSSGSPGFLMYVPYYSTGEAPATVEERRKALIGWVYAPFIAKDFMDAIRRISLHETQSLIHIEIYEKEPFNTSNLIYENSDTRKAEEYFAVNKELELYNNTWNFRVTPTPELSALYSNRYYWVIWLTGGLLGLSLFYVVYLLSRTHRHAIALAEDMTLEIRRKKEELQQKNIELERSNHDLEQFAYVASHDLKEPLRMVNIYTQLLAERYSDKLDNAGKDYIKFATDGATRMGSLINDLLTYASLGNSNYSWQNVDINEVIKRVKNFLHIQISESHAVINININMPKVKGSENYLQSLFQNLIANALKYRKDDIAPVINISAVRKDDFWVFSVSDNGIGIENEHLDKIFIIFQRLHQKNEYAGTGIGLAICKKIVEFHGGTIWAESTRGEGTTILFTLPAVKNK